MTVIIIVVQYVSDGTMQPVMWNMKKHCDAHLICCQGSSVYF